MKDHSFSSRSLSSSKTQGQVFRRLITAQAPLQVVGTINAYSALLAESQGHQAIYLSGAGVANASFGLPDLGMTSLSEVLEEARRITAVSTLPLLVDVDTGWGSAFNIARTVQSMERALVAAIHLEDQVFAKRCGHRPNKKLVSPQEMGDRLKAAVDARVDESFVIMARSDAYAQEGCEAMIERCQFYLDCGADMIFAEAVTELSDYARLAKALDAPILANITEFGKTPLFSQNDLAKAGVSLILYPLTAFRMMAFAALNAYRTIKEKGTQASLVPEMQTRSELYEVLGYLEYEKQLDRLFSEGEKTP